MCDNIEEAYNKKMRDKDDRKTYAKFMKEKGGRAWERHQYDMVDDRERYKNKMKYGKSRGDNEV